MADYSLLLVGTTGNGKSSTGNSILNKKVFTQVDGSVLANNEVKFDTSKIGRTSVAVVDGPGLGDGSFDNIEDVENAITLSKRAVTMLASGFQALLIIRKYGVPVVQTEKDVIKWIKKIFGDSVVRNHGVVVVTHGDRFDEDMKDRRTTFDQWCKDQKGDVQELFKECKQRCVLFNNITNDVTVMKKQVEELFSKIRNIRPYTITDFNAAEIGRSKLIAGAKSAQLQKTTEELLDKTQCQLKMIDTEFLVSFQNQLKSLRQIQADVEQHKNYLRGEDQNSSSLHFLLLQVSETETVIKSKIDKLNKHIDQVLVTMPQQSTPHNKGCKKYVIGFAILLTLGVVLWKRSDIRRCWTRVGTFLMDVKQD